MSDTGHSIVLTNQSILTGSPLLVLLTNPDPPKFGGYCIDFATKTYEYYSFPTSMLRGIPTRAPFTGIPTSNPVPISLP